MKSLSNAFVLLALLSGSLPLSALAANDDVAACGKKGSCLEAANCANNLEAGVGSVASARILAADVCSKDFATYKIDTLYAPLKARCEQEWGKHEGAINRIYITSCVLDAAIAVHDIQAAIDGEE